MSTLENLANRVKKRQQQLKKERKEKNKKSKQKAIMDRDYRALYKEFKESIKNDPKAKAYEKDRLEQERKNNKKRGGKYRQIAARKYRINQRLQEDADKYNEAHQASMINSI